MVGTRDFYAALRLMTGAMLSRLLVGSSYRLISVFNPSVGDFVLQRLRSNLHLLQQCIFSLASEAAIGSLRSMLKNKLFTPSHVQKICDHLIRGIVESQFTGCDSPFVASVATLADLTRPAGHPLSAAYIACVDFCSSNGTAATAEAINLVSAGFERGDVTEARAVAFSETAISGVSSDDEIQSVACLIYLLPDDSPARAQLLELLEARVYEVASEDIETFIDVSDTLNGLERDDETGARKALVDAANRKLDRLDIYPSYDSYAVDLLDSFDVRSAVREYGMSFERDDDESRASSSRPRRRLRRRTDHARRDAPPGCRRTRSTAGRGRRARRPYRPP